MEDEKPPLPAPETVIDVGPATKNTNTALLAEDGRDGTGEKNEPPAAAAVEGSGFLARWKKNRIVNAEAAEKRREDDAEGGGMGNYSRILRYGTRLDAVLMIVGAFAAGAAGAVFPLFTIILGSLVSKFSEFFRVGSTVTPAEFRHSVDKTCLYFVYLFLGKFALAYVAMVCFRITGTRISAGLRLQYLTAIFHQDLTYFDTVSTPKAAKSSMNNHPGRTTASSSAAAASAMSGSAGAVAVSITTLANMVQIGISEKLAMFIQGACTLISAFTIALTRNWKLALVTSVILPIIVIIYAIAVPIDIKLEKRVLKAHEKAADLAQECLGSVRTIKSFCAETRLGERYAKLLEEGKKAGIRKAPVAGLQFFGGFFAIYCGYAICFWFGIKLFVWGQIKEVGTIVIVFFAVLIAVMSFSNIAPPIGAMAKAASASSSMFAVIDRKPEIDALSPAGLKPSKMLTGDLRLENIKFAYPGGGKRDQVVVLGGDDKKGVSIVFREGQTTAIVGRSGCGKSTIVALLERWYDPMQGTVFIGDTDIKDVNLRWWRSRIGLVMQEPFMFNDTIYNNVAWGLTGTEWENAEEDVKRRMVVEACEEANASVFIDTLEKKYDTRVGEQGIMLSGGQKQRVAIARSIISKPSILILDEATSAIDPKNERIVQDALDKVSVGRTTITIAHRLSTVRKANNIIVLDAGKILESGSHEELLKDENGAYAMLVKGQSLVTEDDGEEEIKEEIFEETTGGALLSKINTTLTTRTSPDDIETGLPKTTDVAVEDGKTKPPQFGLIHCLTIMFYEQRHLWWLYAVALATCLGAGGAYPAQAVLFAKFINIFQVGDSAKFVRDGNFWALMFFVLACATGVCYFFMGISFTAIQHHVTSRYRLEYFLNVLRQPISFFDLETSSAGALTSQINTDPAALQELIGTNSGILTISVVNMISCCVLSLAYGWKLGLVCMFAALPFIFSAGLIRVRIEISFAGDAERVFRESAQFASEAVAAYRTVSSLILEEMILERYKTLLSAHVKRSAWKTAKACVLFSASESIGLLAGALTFWYGGRLLSTREYKTEQFFVIYTAIVQGGEAAGQFFAFTPSMAQALSSCNNILKIRESGPPQTGGPMPSPSTTGSHGCEIEFKNVCFKYSSRDTPVFKGLNLKIEAGQFVAFVGASGCGKTTIISLLERFYDVNEGEILIDGKRLDKIDVKEYRSAVSLVAQEPVLYQGTIIDNILLGVDPSSPAASQDSIERACKQAYIHDFITSLPDGYSTLCGSKGIGLSGGQKQRVAIARALIRNPRLLLLDEATAALDSESEGFVQKAILGSREAGRTIIAVAHRLSTVVNADVVFVVVEGKIMEKGTHKELIKKRGVYWEMCRAQALDR